MSSSRDRATKGVKVAVCGIKYIDLTKDAIKILGIFFRIIKILNQNRISFPQIQTMSKLNTEVQRM